MDTTISPLRPDVVGIQTTPRPTATPVRVRFSDVLAGGASAIAQGAQAAVRALPGSPLMAVAVRGGPTVPSSTMSVSLGASATASPTVTGPGIGLGASPEGPGGVTPAGDASGGTITGTDGSLESSMAQSQALNLYYLQVQEEVNAQNRTFTALSNVLEVEHSTAKSAIGNIH
jgi:hypothetical protein